MNKGHSCVITSRVDQKIAVSARKSHILALFEFHEAEGVDHSEGVARACACGTKKNQPMTRQNFHLFLAL